MRPEWRQELREGKTEIFEMPDYCPADIEVSPLERIRYEENGRFSEAVASDLVWLASHRHELDVSSIRQKAEGLAERLSPAQRLPLAKITKNIEATCSESEDANETPETIARAFQFMHRLEPDLPYVSAENVRVTKLGTYELTFPPHEWRRLGRKDLGYVLIELPKDGRLKFDEREQRIILNTVFVKGPEEDQDDAVASKTRENILRHETFHLLNHRFIEPETAPRYHDAVECEVFMMAKNEMIAYLIEGRWEYRLINLFNSTWNEYAGRGSDRNVIDVHIDSGNEIIERVERSLRGENPNSDRYYDEAAQFYLEFYFAQRELARLSALRSSDIKQGIAAILAAQSFKEIGYNLSKIGPRSLDVADIFPMGTDLAGIDAEHIMEVCTFVKSFYKYTISGLEDFARRLQPRVGDAFTVSADANGDYDYSGAQRLQKIESALEGILRVQ